MTELPDEGIAAADTERPPFVRALVRLLSGLLTLAALLWAADAYRKFGLLLFNEQLVAAMLGVALAIVFLHVPARERDRGRLPFYDAVLALVGFLAASYAAIHYETLVDTYAERPLAGMVVGTILCLVVLEALRRVGGRVLFFIVLAFYAYALFGDLVPGDLQGRPINPFDLTLYLAFDTHGLTGAIVGIACTIVVGFIFFGVLLFRSGGSDFFTDIALALMGNYRGGSAKIAVVASALFGTISGSAVANVASTGVVTIPMMIRAGYRPAHAGAIEAVASTGGQLMPPIMGASAFLMAEFLEIPYIEVVLAATIPAILYYVALFIHVDLEAARRGIVPVAKEAIPSARKVLASGWHFPIPFVVVIAGMFHFNLAPATAALYGSAALAALGFAFGYRGKRLTLQEFVGAFEATGTAVIDIIMIAAAAACIIGILFLSGLGYALTLTLVELGRGNLLVLLTMAAAISIVLGMGMPTVGVYVLLAALVAPSLVQVGIAPIAAHLFILYFGMMSMVTPPVAIAAYAGAAIAKADPVETALAGIRFGWTAYIVPFLFVFSPSLLLQGDPAQIALAVITALGGVWLVTAGVIGYMTQPLGPAVRVGFAVAGLLLMVPAQMFPGAIWTDVGGLVLGAGLIGREMIAKRVKMHSTA